MVLLKKNKKHYQNSVPGLAQEIDIYAPFFVCPKGLARFYIARLLGQTVLKSQKTI